MIWWGQNGPIHSKIAIHLGIWWKYSLCDTKIMYFPDLVSSRKGCFNFSAVENTAPSTWFHSFYLQKYSFNLGLEFMKHQVWIFVIIFWLIKISLIDFNNRIIYQNNILTRVLWAWNDMGSPVIMDDFCYLTRRCLNNSHPKGRQI